MKVIFKDGSEVVYVNATGASVDEESGMLLIDNENGIRIAEVVRGDCESWESVSVLA